jgi:hypothetical protein
VNAKKKKKKALGSTKKKKRENQVILINRKKKRAHTKAVTSLSWVAPFPLFFLPSYPAFFFFCLSLPFTRYPIVHSHLMKARC